MRAVNPFVGFEGNERLKCKQRTDLECLVLFVEMMTDTFAGAAHVSEQGRTRVMSEGKRHIITATEQFGRHFLIALIDLRELSPIARADID